MKKTILAAALGACLMIQPCMTSFAATANEALGPGYLTASEEKSSGPGYSQYSGGPGATVAAWTKNGNVYMDDSENKIEGAVLRGISVSKWQGDINWGKVAADDVSFALIRMGSFGF